MKSIKWRGEHFNKELKFGISQENISSIRGEEVELLKKLLLSEANKVKNEGNYYWNFLVNFIHGKPIESEDEKIFYIKELSMDFMRYIAMRPKLEIKLNFYLKMMTKFLFIRLKNNAKINKVKKFLKNYFK